MSGSLGPAAHGAPAPPWIRRRRQWSSSPVPAASSATARCTTSTRVRWITGQRGRRGLRHRQSCRAIPGSPSSATSTTAATVVTFDQGTLGVVSVARYNGRGYDVPPGSARLRRHRRRRLAIRRTRCGIVDPHNDFPTGPTHRFFMDRFTEAFRAELAAFVRGGRGRCRTGLHGGRRRRGRMAGRGGHRIPAPARTGAYRGGTRMSSRPHCGSTHFVGCLRGTRMGLPADPGARSR